jgi:hypothetical protein
LPENMNNCIHICNAHLSTVHTDYDELPDRYSGRIL